MWVKRFNLFHSNYSNLSTEAIKNNNNRCSNWNRLRDSFVVLSNSTKDEVILVKSQCFEYKTKTVCNGTFILVRWSALLFYFPFFSVLFHTIVCRFNLVHSQLEHSVQIEFHQFAQSLKDNFRYFSSTFSPSHNLYIFYVCADTMLP